MENTRKVALAAGIIARKAATKRRRFFMFGAILFIIFLIAVALIIKRRRIAANITTSVLRNEPVMSKEEKITQLTEKKVELKEKVKKAGEQFGMTEKDIDTMIPKVNTPPPGTDPNLKCAVYPINGSCDSRFYDLKDGCCELRDNSDAVARAAHTKAMKALAYEIGVTTVVEEILTNLLPKIIKGEIGGKLAARLKGFIDDAAKMGAKFAPMMARLVGKVSRSIFMKMMVRGAATLMRLIAKLGSGPVGWALMVLDVFTILADMGDGSNYDSWIENKMFIDMRNQIVYQMWEAVNKEGNDLPVIFPVEKLFPLEMEAAQSTMISSMIEQMIPELLKTANGTQVVVKLMARAASEEDGDTPGPETELNDADEKLFSDMMIKIRNQDTIASDKILFNNLLTNLSDENKKYVMLVPFMSSENSVGISLTKDGATKWNEEHRQEWFDNNDLFFPPNKPKDYQEPFAAIYTKRYLTIDTNNPGTADNPTIIFKDLPNEVALMYPFGMLVANCEKPRTSNKYKDPIDPVEFGVNFEYSTGVCNFTKDYCQRYGLEQKNKDWGETEYVDCVKKPGQAAAEAVLGPSLTRASIRVWDDRKDGLKSDDPAKVAETVALIAVDPTGLGSAGVTGAIDAANRREKEYGTAATVGLTIVDPLGIYENFGKNMKEQLAGRDKYCVQGDTCKRFHAKHNGGNFMNWSVRGPDGSIYSNGQGYQNQVKDSEDHVFFIPTDGYFKVSCQPGEKRNFTYDEITDPFKVSCALGKIKINRSRGDQAVDAMVGIAEETGKFVVDAGNAAAEAAEAAAEAAIVDAGNAAAEAAEAVAKAAEKEANKAVEAAEKAADEAAKAVVDYANQGADAVVNVANQTADAAVDYANQGADAVVNVANQGTNYVKDKYKQAESGGKKVVNAVASVFPPPPSGGGCVIM